MPDRQIIINQAGPLPITKQLQIKSNGPAMLFLSGSVWTQEAAGSIGVAVLVNGHIYGDSIIWSNQPATHRATVPMFIPIELDAPWPDPETPPTYTFELQAMNGETISDENDWFQLSMVA